MKTFYFDRDKALSLLWAMKAEIQEDADSDARAKIITLKDNVMELQSQVQTRVAFEHIADAFLKMARDKSQREMLCKLLDDMRNQETDDRITALQEQIKTLDKDDVAPLASLFTRQAWKPFETLPSTSYSFLAGMNLEDRYANMTKLLETLREDAQTVRAQGKNAQNSILVKVFEDHKKIIKQFPSRDIYDNFFAPLLDVTAHGAYNSFADMLSKKFPFLQGYPNKG